MKDRSWIRNAKIIELTHGQMFSDDQFKKNLERMRPDAIMGIGCTHDGTVGFLSSVGPNRGEEADEQTRKRIDIAHSMGIKVIGTHSGVGNRAAGDAHPEWIRIRADGTPSTDNFAGWQMDLLSGYPEAWFLIQVEEMFRDYGADGLWVDGDSWYVRPCYSERTIERFVAETGYEPPRISQSDWQMTVPTASGARAEGEASLSDEDLEKWHEWMRFTREVFWEFQRKTGELCHRYGGIYASNGTHSVDSGPVAVPEWMDMLSHDIPGYESSGAFMASLKARFNGTQGVPHDVMTWDHNSRNPWAKPEAVQVFPKGEDQYLAEVCSAVANGAIWDHWTTRRHNGSAWKIADYLTERSEHLFETESAADIAVLHSSTSFFRNNGGFLTTSPGNHPVWGAAQALWEGGFAFDLVSEHNLERLMPKYRLLILAHQTHLDDATISLLDRFVQQGGTLLSAGRSGIPDGSRCDIASILGIESDIESIDSEGVTFPASPEIMGVDQPDGADSFAMTIQGDWVRAVPTNCSVELGAMVADRSGPPDARGPVGWIWEGHSLSEDRSFPVLTRNKHGEGAAWYLAIDLFRHYYRTQYFGIRNLITDIITKALPMPAARATGSLPVECALRNKGDAVYCHVVNINTVSRNNRIETQAESIPSVSNVQVEYRSGEPVQVTDEESGKLIDCSYSDGLVTINVGAVGVMRSMRIE